MGFKVSWIGFQGLDKAAALEQLEFVETGNIDHEQEAPFSLAELPSGWLVIFANDPGWATPGRVGALSMGGVAVGCQMSEVVMYSAAWGYEGGLPQWSLVHYRDENKELEVGGVPPVEFSAIRDEATRDQEREGAGVDYIFEVPVALTAAICGFRPDRLLPGLQPVFRELSVAGVVPRHRPHAVREKRRNGGLFDSLGKLFRGGR